MSYSKFIEDAIKFASDADNLIQEKDVINLRLKSKPHPMSTHNSQTLINKLCKAKKTVNYLEIGILHGASFFAACYNNSGNFYGVDNWSKYKNSEGTIKKHINKYSTVDRNITFINSDCWNLDNLKNNIKHKIDILFYDGDHSYESQSKALSYFSELLADEIIFIVDDYFCASIQEGVHKGTADTIANSDFNLVQEFTIKNKDISEEIKTMSRKKRNELGRKNNLWHNGFYIVHLKR